MKAQEWLDRGNQEDDPIDAFLYFWLGFNSLFFGKGSERHMIKGFLGQSISEADAEALLHSHAAEVSYLLSQPVIDMQGKSRDTAKHIEAFNTATSPLVKLQEVFMVIYQVRCNLVHGQKSPSRERDVQLCRCASPLVAYAIGKKT